MNRSTEDAERLRLIGRLAALSFFAIPLLTIPLYAGLGSDDVDALVPLGVVSVIVGIAVLAVPFDRAPRWWIPALGIVAFSMTTWGSSVTGNYAAAALWPFLIVAAFVSITIDDVAIVAALLAYGCVGMVVGLLLGGDGGPARAATVVAIPALLGISAILTTMRRREREQAERLRMLAKIDALTQVGNRRLLDERLDYEVRRHRRTGKPLGLFIVDLDAFKDVNDRVGHLAGDELLRTAAAALVGVVRASDTVVRYGGDEFAILAPEIEEGGADRLAEGIARAFESVQAAGRPLTASLGWALFPQDAEDAQGLLAAADARERRAKIQSR